jgi:lipopolysaccharide export system ATP-binding protein
LSDLVAADAVLPRGRVLRALGLTKSYARRVVVREVDLDIRQGEVVGLLGPNGAGKTTTFYMVVGLTRPDRGQVFLGGRGHHRASHVPARPRRDRIPPPGGQRLPQAERSRRTCSRSWRPAGSPRPSSAPTPGSCSRSSGIQGMARQPAYTLSGGERRRLEICRALAAQPSFILLDEPFAGHRPAGRPRHPEDHRPPARSRDRDPDHRPQRPRDLENHGSGLYSEGRSCLPLRHSPRARLGPRSATGIPGRGLPPRWPRGLRRAAAGGA